MENVLGYIDKNIDTLFTTDRKPSWKRIYKLLQEKPELKSKVIEYLKTETQDLFLLKTKQLSKNELNQLKEAYAYLPLKRKNEILKTINDVIEVIERGKIPEFLNTTNQPKQKINKFDVFPYRKQWYDLKSINLKDIILMKNLIVYEINTATLYFYTTPYLFDITKTSLKNFDKEKSFALKSIKNRNILKQIQANDLAVIKSFYEQAKMNGKKVKQRFNENMLILWGSKKTYF